MPGLIKNTVEIPLGLGIQTDVDDKLLPAGKVVTLENGVWERGGEILKRVGSFALGTQYAANTPGTMPAAWQLATHKGALVSLSKAGPRPIGVYSPALQKWVAPAGSTALDNINGVFSKLRGQVLPRRGTVYRSNAIGGTTNVVEAPDVATNGTYALVGWTETNAATGATTIKAQILELATGKTLFTFSTAGTFAASAVRTVFANGDFQLIYSSGANVRVVLWSAANITAGTGSASAPFTLATDATSLYFDAIANGVTTIVIYNALTTRIIRSTSGGAVTVSNLTDGGGGAISPGLHSWVRDVSGSGAVAAVTSSAGQGVRVQWNVNTGTGATGTTYTIDGAAGEQFVVTGHTISNAGTGEFIVLYHLFAAGVPSIKFGRRTVASGVTSGTWILSAAIASQPFLHNGEFYNLIAYDDDEQGTLFAIRVPTNPPDATDGNRTPSARFCSGAAARIPKMAVPSAISLSADVFLSCASVKVRAVNLATAQFNTGIDTITLTYNPANVNSPREFADNLYVCGGVLGAFDGMTYAEEGFHLFPPQPTVSQAAFGLLTPLGNYEVCAVYRYTDDFGRLRRSAPSDPVSVALTGTNGTINATVKTLKLHGRASPGGVAGKVVIEVYQTTNNAPDAFYLSAVVANDESVDTVTVALTTADTSTVNGEQLYTDGGILEFQSPPPALAVATYKDRVAVIAADDPTLIWISLPLSETEGPRFNSESTIRIDDARGDLTGLAAVDDKLIAFKRDAIYVITGDGPDVAGNGSFGIATPFALGVGTVEPRSIVEVPDGVMFRSSSTRAGIFLVNRGLAIEYAGKDVERFVTGGLAFPVVTIADAIHVPGLTRTEFLTTLGTTLIYDYTLKLWATATNQATTAATVWNGRHAYLISTSILFVAAERTDDTFDDTSSPVGLYLETPWLALNKLKGFEKFFKVQLVGEKRIINDAGDPGYILELSIYKDYNLDAFLTRQTRTMTVSDDPNLVELKFPSKLGAIKIGVGVRMNPTDGANFAGPKLSALVIQYGMKEGLRKTAYTNRTT